MNLTQRDNNQISQYEHEETLNAKRVLVVGQDIKVDTDSIVNAVKEGLKNLEIKVSPNEAPKEEAKPQIIKEIEFKEIEKPVYIEKIEYREIEKPIVIEKTVFTEIEKPIFIEKIVEKEVIREKIIPKWQQICIFLQTASFIGFLIAYLIK